MSFSKFIAFPLKALQMHLPHNTSVKWDAPPAGQLRVSELAR